MMFKRAGHILVILLLLLGTTGVSITRHYCGGNLVHTSLYSASYNCCNGNCPRCHDERINARITDTYESSQSQINLTAGFKNLLEQHSLPTILAFSNASNIALLNDASGDHSIKPFLTKSISPGHSTSFLQVFLV
jgi:hypothetical protein